MTAAEAARAVARLANVSAHWSLLAVDDAILERTGHTLPIEPIRTLDAIHLASALAAAAAVGELSVLTLDHRVRDCAAALGFLAVPQTP